MAWATAIVRDEQVAYRVAGKCGCDRDHPSPDLDADGQVDYRLGADLAWIGSGLGEVGLVAGERVDPDAARALMNGADPRTGDLLLAPKKVPGPMARVPASVYVDAVRAAAEEAGADPVTLFRTATARARWARLVRALQRDGAKHTIPITDLEELAAAGPVDLDTVYPADVLEFARRNRGDRATIGVRGHDVVLNVPKSISALYAIADPATAAVIEAEYLAAVGETVAAIEAWAGYAVSGHQGDGQLAQRVPSTGLIGWTMLHRSARPTVPGQAGDPHLHAHAVIAHMVHCPPQGAEEEGKWRVPGSGGRDIYRHVAAAGELVKARVRARLTVRLGVGWTQDETTREWEITGIPAELRGEFSQRAKAIAAALVKQGTPDATAAQQRSVARRLAEARPDIEVVDDVRAAWQQRAAAVVDVPAVLAATLRGGPDGPAAGPAPGPQPGPAPAPAAGPVAEPGAGRSVAEIAAAVWTGEHALTAHTKAVTRAQVLAAVAGACPAGVEGLAELEALTDAVIAAGPVLAVEAVHASHHTNTQRWTTRDIVDAEATVLAAARAGIGAGVGAVDLDTATRVWRSWQARRGIVLSPEQRAAVTRLVTAGYGVDVVVGVAGAGKTTLMDAARAAWEAAGLRVAGASTAAVAAAGLRAESGIASRTVASLLMDVDAGRGLRADVLVVDEGAVVDDRHLARITTAAAAEGCKVVLIGDHLQLRAIGVGGTFAAVHAEVGGLTLTENRRQRDAAEREALATWRAGARRTALAALAGQGRVHATDTAEQARAQLAAAYVTASGAIADPHARARAVLLMAPRVDDVDALNTLVRAHLADAGQLTGEVSFRRSIAAGGGSIEYAAGDLVRVRRNDYRSRRSTDPDVLNGYRGVVLAVDRHRGVLAEWTRAEAGGTTVTESAWIRPAAIAAGHLSHGYALTVAAAQGQTCDQALLYGGVGADDAHTLYPGLTRARERTDLWIPRTLMEDPETAARLGDPDDPDDQLARAVAALAATLDQSRPDTLITPHLIHQGDQADADQHDQAAEPARPDGPGRKVVDDAQPAAAAAKAARPGRRRSGEGVAGAWRSRPAGRHTDEMLHADLAQARHDVAALEHALALVQALPAGLPHDQVDLHPAVGYGQDQPIRDYVRNLNALIEAAGHDQDAAGATRAAVVARTELAGHVGAADAARARIADLTGQAARRTAVFTRGRLTREADTVRDSLGPLADAIWRTRDDAQDHERAAAHHARTAHQLRTQAGALPGESDDQAADRLRHTVLDHLDGNLARARTELDRLQTETTYRDGLSPADRRRENAERHRAIARRLQEQATRPRSYRPPNDFTPQPGWHPPPPHLGPGPRGPSLGR